MVVDAEGAHVIDGLLVGSVHVLIGSRELGCAVSPERMQTVSSVIVAPLPRAGQLRAANAVPLSEDVVGTRVPALAGL
jgi:hypothetical protein